MSYDLRIRVKAEGCDEYPVIAIPEYDSPTYNLGQMFRVCMDWDFEQSKNYNCAGIIVNIEKGIRTLHTNKETFRQYEPDNKWGTVEDAIKVLESLRSCIYETAETVPLNYLYMTW